MVVLKKLIFAPFFIVCFVLLFFQFTPFLKSYEAIFSLSVNTFYQLVIICVLIILSSFSFVIFAAIAGDWRLILPVGFIAALTCFLQLSPSLGLILTAIIMAAILITYFPLNSKLKNYLSFEPTSLLGPSIRQLSSFLILALSVSFFLSISPIIEKVGFQIPDALVEASMKFVPTPQLPNQSQTVTQQISIPVDQLELLKKNPDLLKQYDLDPKMLDSLNQSSDLPLSQNFVRQTIKDQFSNIIKPYLGIIPIILAVLIFFTLQSLTSFLGLLIYPLIWVTFFILEKTNFIGFTEEMRPVKKMVV